MTERIALITGSTSGIGLGIASKLAENGYHIAINGFGDKDEIAQTCRMLSDTYAVNVYYSDADMSNTEQISQMITNINDHFGTCIDVLVNNAGIQHVSPIEYFSVEQWDAVIAINLSSAFHTIRNVIKKMKEQSFGRIINIASAHGLVASANKAAYVAAKHGIVGLTKVVALETAEINNITCNALCPGWVLTPLVNKQIENIAREQKISYDEAKIALLSEKQPSKEFVTVDEIGTLTAYLCQDGAKSMNGSIISIDGGWTAT